MSLTAAEKGKGRALPQEDVDAAEQDEIHNRATSSVDADSDSSASDSEDDSADSDTSDDEDEISEEFMESLLEKARQNMSAKKQAAALEAEENDEVINLGGDDLLEVPLPALDPGKLPAPYIDLTESSKAGPRSSKVKIRDLDVEQIEKVSSSAVPSAPAPPPSAQPKKQPTKKEQKALKSKTAGKGWFDLPAPEEADLPKLYREVEALRLRNQLDPKRFYRKEEGEGKGIKGLPKYFAMGKILPDATPFASSAPGNLARSQRKRTLVDELVDDAEAKSYAKKKFKELQSVRGARGRGTLARRREARKPKW